MLQKLKVNQKGFTLIELMIVIAIIGILAAIAIPQFAAYRIRGFNSSGQSDVRNLATSQAALFSDWQVFGGTGTVANANPIVFAAFATGAGTLLRGPSGAAGVPGNVPVLQITAQGANRGVQIPLGNNVMIIDITDATNQSFTGVSKHVGGNSYYAVDSDVTAIYFDDTPGSNGTLLVAGNCPASVVGADDFQINGPSGNPWAVR